MPLSSELIKKVVQTQMYAIIESGGKQFKVQKGDVIYVEKIPGESESSVEFKVVACQTENGFVTGRPYLENSRVFGKLLKTAKGQKITVFTYKPKKHVKRKMGHRQWYTKVEINEIVPDLKNYK